MDRNLIDEKTEEAWQKLQAGDPGWFLWFNNNGTRTLADLTMQALIARMAAEMAKDAERYRWLREHGDAGCTQKDGYGGQELRMGDSLDAAIDAEMAQAEGTQEKS